MPFSARLGFLRSSAFTPASVAGLYCWLDGSDSSTVTLNAGNVSQWRDKSGNARHFSQSTSAAQPAYTTAGQNGLNCLTFNGSNRLGSDLASSAWAFLHDGSVLYDLFIVWKTAAGSTTLRTILATGNSSYGVRSFYMWHDHRSGQNNTVGGWITGIGGVGLVAAQYIANQTAGTMRWARYSANPAAASLVNRGAIVVGGTSGTYDTTANATASSGNPTFTATIGSLSSTGQSFGFNGVLCEIIIYTGASALPSGDRTSIQNYLASKWGL